MYGLLSIVLLAFFLFVFGPPGRKLGLADNNHGNAGHHSTPKSPDPIMATIEEMTFGIAENCRDRPSAVMRELKQILIANKHSPAMTFRLMLIIEVLVSCIQGKPGYPKLEGALWKACVEIELPLLALGLIKKPGFVDRELVRWPFPHSMGSI